MFTVPWRICDVCGERYAVGTPHSCDVDTRFLFQERQRRRAELDAALAELDEELQPENAAAQLEAWAENATDPPCPIADEGDANVSLPKLREFADWQREHEDEET